MGTYVYAVRRRFVNATLLDGTPATLWILKYLYKPSFSRRNFNIPYQAVIARLHNAFENANVKPEYIVHIFEKVEEGDQVRKWTGQISCSDASGSLPGEVIGYLKRVGRKWTVVEKNPKELEYAGRNDARPPIFNTDSNGTLIASG